MYIFVQLCSLLSFYPSFEHVVNGCIFLLTAKGFFVNSMGKRHMWNKNVHFDI